jgi:NAD(P)H-flavin reductase
VRVLLGARTAADLYGEDWLQGMATRWRADFDWEAVLSAEPAASDWRGRRGLVTEAIEPALADWDGAHVYMAGPPPMIDAALDRLAAAGVPSTAVRFDRFEGQ